MSAISAYDPPPGPVVIAMPERIDWNTVDQVLRTLGFDPHQVSELHITRNTTGQPLVAVSVHAHNQTITRAYATHAAFKGVQVLTREQAAEREQSE